MLFLNLLNIFNSCMYETELQTDIFRHYFWLVYIYNLSITNDLFENNYKTLVKIMIRDLK